MSETSVKPKFWLDCHVLRAAAVSWGVNEFHSILNCVYWTQTLTPSSSLATSQNWKYCFIFFFFVTSACLFLFLCGDKWAVLTGKCKSWNWIYWYCVYWERRPLSCTSLHESVPLHDVIWNEVRGGIYFLKQLWKNTVSLAMPHYDARLNQTVTRKRYY